MLSKQISYCTSAMLVVSDSESRKRCSMLGGWPSAVEPHVFCGEIRHLMHQRVVQFPRFSRAIGCHGGRMCMQRITKKSLMQCRSAAA